MYIYGPVPSRRLGFSLGIDLLFSKKNNKRCNFDCIYCQLGRTFKKSIKRFFSVDLDRFKKELKRVIKKNPNIDYISISGSGEPTLHKYLDRIILIIKKITNNKYPICVITNSSFLFRKDVRRELMKADLIIPSLDAACLETFKKINRPEKNVKFEKILEGLIKLREEFKGEIWLEIMLVAGINDTISEATKFKKLIEKIKPNKIQINLPIRPSLSNIKLPSTERINLIKKIINGNIEVIQPFFKCSKKRYYKNIKIEILNYLKRRPATISDFKKVLNINKNLLLKNLNELINKNKIDFKIYRKNKYFIFKND